MDIYLIRHTTPNVPPGTCYGQSDVGLASSFADECTSMFAKLPAHWDRVYCSPLSRCQLLAKQLHPQPTEDARLQELDFGDWEGQAWSDIDPAKLNPWMNDFVNVACPGGESYQEMAERITAFWKDLTSEAYQNVAVVTHAGPIRALLAHVLSLPIEHSFRLAIDYGSVSLVQWQPQYLTVRFVNA